MIGLDSNILVRLLTRDDERQWRIVVKLIESRCSPERPGRIDTIVLVETTWTLRRVFGFSRRQVADAVEALLATSSLAVEREDRVVEALARSTTENVDLADVLISLSNAEAGCVETLTFDRRAARSGVMTLLEASR